MSKEIKPGIPEWIDEYADEPMGLGSVFGQPLYVSTEKPTAQDDEGYRLIKLINATSGVSSLVRMHTLTIRELANYIRTHPEEAFALSYNRESRKVDVLPFKD